MGADNTFGETNFNPDKAFDLEKALRRFRFEVAPLVTALEKVYKEHSPLCLIVGTSTKQGSYEIIQSEPTEALRLKEQINKIWVLKYLNNPKYNHFD